jgi:outer membrane protein TolC
VVCALVAATGCSPTQPFYLHEDGDLSHYIDKATAAEHPDLDQLPLAEVENAAHPLTLSNPNFKEFWELTLEECVSIALANSKVIRGGSPVNLQNGQLFAGTQEGRLISGPRQFASIYNPAVSETNPGQRSFALFGGQGADGPSQEGGGSEQGLFVRQGVEAALSEFDAQVSFVGNPGAQIASSTDRPQNVNAAFTGFPQVLDLRQGGATAQIQKRSATGTQFAARSTTEYDRGIQRGNFQALNSIWTQTLEVEVRHPLLRGGGVQINRMPIVLARIGTDVEILGVQDQLQDMLNNLELRYWDLYLRYRNLETAKVGRDSALVTWRIVYDKWVNDVEPVQAEAQAREQYFSFRAQVENALRELYDAENELRLLMGLAATDCRLIRPKDDPTLARVEFEWCEILAESIARRPELIQQRWVVKYRELELIQARNFLLPQLDVGAFYRWLGVGDDLIHANPNGIKFPGQGSDAWSELTGGDFQEWGFLLSYNMPVGFRRELAGVRHAQLRLARDKAFLEDMELDVSHGLAKSVRHLDTSFQLSQTNANRWAASQKEVEAMEALYRGGRVALNDVLEAQRRRAIAQAAFWLSVTEYNKAIADLHTRKGSIMEYNGICFEEGPWPQKAYWDALARARERDAGTYIDYGWTRPKVVSRGEIPQVAPGIDAFPHEGIPHGAAEEVLTPEPTPAQPPAASEDALPEPRTVPMPPVPLETRARPLQSARPKLSAARPGSDAAATTAEGTVAKKTLAQFTAANSPTPTTSAEPIPARTAATLPADSSAPAGNMAPIGTGLPNTIRPVKQIAPATFISGDSGAINPLRSSR